MLGLSGSVPGLWISWVNAIHVLAVPPTGVFGSAKGYTHCEKVFSRGSMRLPEGSIAMVPFGRHPARVSDDRMNILEVGNRHQSLPSHTCVARKSFLQIRKYGTMAESMVHGRYGWPVAKKRPGTLTSS